MYRWQNGILAPVCSNHGHFQNQLAQEAELCLGEEALPGDTDQDTPTWNLQVLEWTQPSQLRRAFLDPCPFTLSPAGLCDGLLFA
jgi:hypothetical protein